MTACQSQASQSPERGKSVLHRLRLAVHAWYSSAKCSNFECRKSFNRSIKIKCEQYLFFFICEYRKNKTFSSFFYNLNLLLLAYNICLWVLWKRFHNFIFKWKFLNFCQSCLHRKYAHYFLSPIVCYPECVLILDLRLI